MRTLNIIIIGFALVSCSSIKNLKTEKVVGKYLWKSIYGVGSTIEIKDDQTFEYGWVEGLNNGKTNGRWKMEGNKILLHSYLQPLRESKNYELLKTDSQISDSISIKIVDSNNLPMQFASSALKVDTTYIAWANTNSEGETKLPRLAADSLIIPYVGYKTIRHPMDKTVTHYEFKMQTVIEYYEHFTNDIWTYRNGRLYPPIEKPKYRKGDSFKRIK